MLPKPYINYGPQIIEGRLHGTKCSLLLYENDDSELKLFRAGRDQYPHSSNFSALPELILSNSDEGI